MTMRGRAGLRTTARFAPGLSNAEEGIGGTGGTDAERRRGGGGERERARCTRTTEGVRRCVRRGVPGVAGLEAEEEGEGTWGCEPMRVPNSSPSNQSCFWILGVSVIGSGRASFSRSGEPTRRGGIGGSWRFEGKWRREREEMRRGPGGGDGRGLGAS